MVIDLLPGHPVHHEREDAAGVVMAISVTANQPGATDLVALCDDLRTAAGLKHETSGDLALEVVFIVPYKGMAIEGYYFPVQDELASGTLLRGDSIARETLDAIIGGAGLPAGLLDERDVELEISCEIGTPAWLVRWEDIRPLAGATPDAVIERAHRRFMAAYRGVLDASMAGPMTAHRR